MSGDAKGGHYKNVNWNLVKFKIRLLKWREFNKALNRKKNLNNDFCPKKTLN